MYKAFVLVLGILSAIAAFIATGFEFISYLLFGVGMLFMLFSSMTGSPSSTELQEGRRDRSVVPAIWGLVFFSVAVGSMSMDGSYLLLAVSTIFSVGLAVGVGYTVMGLRGSFTGTHLALITSFALPVLGLSLVQYLLHTERSILSGLLVIGMLTWIGYKIAPRAVERPHRPNLRVVTS